MTATELHAALLAAAEDQPPAEKRLCLALLKLHKPASWWAGQPWRVYCAECGGVGVQPGQERSWWDCRTIQAIAEHLGVPLEAS